MTFDYLNIFEPLFSEQYPNYGQSSRGEFHLVEHDEHSFLYVSAPGYKKDDLTVEMQEGRLSIKGKPSTDKSVGVLVPNQIDLKYSVSSNFLVDSAELVDGILAVKLVKARKTEAVKIPISIS